MIDFMKKLLLILGAGTLLVFLAKQFLPRVLGSSNDQSAPGSASVVATADTVKGIFQPALFNINIHNER